MLPPGGTAVSSATSRACTLGRSSMPCARAGVAARRPSRIRSFFMAASYIRSVDFSLGEAGKGNDGMRVTGGKLGGRRLVAPDDAHVRPTSDRTRQAIFNILEHRDFNIGFTVENAAVADLFAGTGALGIEALSR